MPLPETIGRSTEIEDAIAEYEVVHFFSSGCLL
jgi:hypothetical protein